MRERDLQKPRNELPLLWTAEIVQELERLATMCDAHSHVVARRLRVIADIRIGGLEENFTRVPSHVVPFSEGFLGGEKLKKLGAVLNSHLPQAKRQPSTRSQRSVGSVLSCQEGLLPLLQTIIKLDILQDIEMLVTSLQTMEELETLTAAHKHVTLHTIMELRAQLADLGKNPWTAALIRTNRDCLHRLHTLESYETTAFATSEFRVCLNTVSSTGTSQKTVSFTLTPTGQASDPPPGFDNDSGYGSFLNSRESHIDRDQSLERSAQPSFHAGGKSLETFSPSYRQMRNRRPSTGLLSTGSRRGNRRWPVRTVRPLKSSVVNSSKPITIGQRQPCEKLSCTTSASYTSDYTATSTTAVGSMPPRSSVVSKSVASKSKQSKGKSRMANWGPKTQK